MWVGWAIGAVTLVAGFIYFLKTHKRKVVSYTHNSTPVLVKDKPAGLVITYSGTVVERPVVNTVRLRATGNAEIRKGDFESDIEIRLVGVDSVITPQIQRKIPSAADIEVKQGVTGDTIYVAPTLLNPGNGFDLQVVSDEMPSSIEVSARAAGLPIPKRTPLPYSVLVSPPERVDFVISLMVPLFMVFAGYLGVGGAFSSANKELYMRLIAAGFGVGMAIGGFFLLYRLVTTSRLRRIFRSRNS